MKSFVCTEVELKFKHPETEALVIMRKGDSLSFDGSFVAAMCDKGWGTSEGVETGNRKPGASEMVLASTKSNNLNTGV